jgi:hypothetical protein
MLFGPTPHAPKILDVPERSLVEYLGETVPLRDGTIAYERVSYVADRKTFTGWM